MSNPVYECYTLNSDLVATFSSFDLAAMEWYTNPIAFEIRCRCSDPKLNAVLENSNQIEAYRTYMKGQTHEDYWSSQIDRPKSDAVNPSHYQGYIQTEVETLQWLEAMQYLPNFRDPKCFKAAVELQARKYLDRNGGKDAELQELQKGLWYFKFLVAYIKNGDKPIRVKDIDSILNG